MNRKPVIPNKAQVSESLEAAVEVPPLQEDRLNDENLDLRVYGASWGRELDAKMAIFEIGHRLLAGQRLTTSSVVALVGALLAAANGKDAATFFPQRTKRDKRPVGRPNSVDPLTRLLEAMTLSQVRKEGFSDLSPDRAEASGKKSSYQETAERMGLQGLKARQAAERMRKSVENAKRKLGRRMPELFAVNPKEP